MIGQVMALLAGVFGLSQAAIAYGWRGSWGRGELGAVE